MLYKKINRIFKLEKIFEKLKTILIKNRIIQLKI